MAQQKTFQSSQDILDIKRSSNPCIFLQYSFKNNLISTFFNTAITLRILRFHSVSVASDERSFSKFKNKLFYLRFMMHHARLNNLPINSLKTRNFK